MFNIFLNYPSYQEEVSIVKVTTSDEPRTVQTILSAEDILAFQHLVRRVPIADNVVEYAVRLSHLTGQVLTAKPRQTIFWSGALAPGPHNTWYWAPNVMPC